MTNNDPLDGADIGETKAVERTADVSVWGVAPEVFFGADRTSDVEVVDAEIVGEPGDERVEVTFQGEVTKYLAVNWDRAQQPRTEEERREVRKQKWKGRVLKFAGIAIPFGIASAIMVRVMQTVSGEMTVEGEPVVFSGETFAVVMAVVFVLALALTYAPGWVSPGGGADD